MSDVSKVGPRGSSARIAPSAVEEEKSTPLQELDAELSPGGIDHGLTLCARGLTRLMLDETGRMSFGSPSADAVPSLALVDNDHEVAGSEAAHIDSSQKASGMHYLNRVRKLEEIAKYTTAEWKELNMHKFFRLFDDSSDQYVCPSMGGCGGAALTYRLLLFVQPYQYVGISGGLGVDGLR